jgi:hypothetical protein
MERALAAVAVAMLAGLMAFAPLQAWDEEWRMKSSGNPGKVHFTIERTRPGSRWVNSSDVSLERFRGLPANGPASSGPANFEFIGDAGRLICKGHFSNGRGIGTYEFVRNTEFGAALLRLGFDAPADDQLFPMLIADVTLEFARGVKDAGLQASSKQLLEMRIHGVTLDYIQQMRSTGYTALTAKDYVEMRIHGVSPELVRELKQAGYDIPARNVIEMRIHGVTPEYIRQLGTYGLRPSAAEVVEMKIHGVQPEYLKGFRDAGYGTFGVREVIDMRIHGVKPEFAQEAVQLGYKFTAKELTEMRIHGVNGEYLRKLKTAGFQNLTADKIVKLKIHGID